MTNFDSLSFIVKNVLETVKKTVTLGFILIDKKELVNVMYGGQNNPPQRYSCWNLGKLNMLDCMAKGTLLM